MRPRTARIKEARSLNFATERSLPSEVLIKEHDTESASEPSGGWKIFRHRGLRGSVNPGPPKRPCLRNDWVVRHSLGFVVFAAGNQAVRFMPRRAGHVNGGATRVHSDLSG